MKIAIGVIVGLITAAAAAWFFLGESVTPPAPEPDPAVNSEPATEPAEETDIEVEEEIVEVDENIFGKSVNGRDLRFERFGDGEEELVLIGGIHGGYEWNTVILAEQFIQYYKENPTAVPDDMTITIIPNLNPDGLHEVVAVQPDGTFTSAMIAENTAPGRFNSNNVDLNRNFDCKWQPKATWRSEEVSSGSEAFSEPESAALRDLLTKTEPELVVIWHSASNGVYGSQCESGILPATITYGEAYSEASGYPWIEVFEHYEVTGDASDWLASIGIPSIAIELKTHETVEWEENFAGVSSLIQLMSSGDQGSQDDVDGEQTENEPQPQ